MLADLSFGAGAVYKHLSKEQIIPHSQYTAGISVGDFACDSPTCSGCVFLSRGEWLAARKLYRCVGFISCCVRIRWLKASLVTEAKANVKGAWADGEELWVAYIEDIAERGGDFDAFAPKGVADTCVE